MVILGWLIWICNRRGGSACYTSFFYFFILLQYRCFFLELTLFRYKISLKWCGRFIAESISDHCILMDGILVFEQQCYLWRRIEILNFYLHIKGIERNIFKTSKRIQVGKLIRWFSEGNKLKPWHCFMNCSSK